MTMPATAASTTDNLTIDANGALVLPPEILRVLRPEDEPLTLVDLTVQGGTLVLRRSTNDEDDWWAYTPEHRAAIDRAQQQEGFHLTRAELEGLTSADDPEAAVQELLRLKRHDRRT